MTDLFIGLAMGFAGGMLLSWLMRSWAVKRFLRKYEEKARVAREEKDQRTLDHAAIWAAADRVRSRKRRPKKRRKK